jgi:hypothetical protein
MKIFLIVLSLATLSCGKSELDKERVFAVQNRIKSLNQKMFIGKGETYEHLIKFVGDTSSDFWAQSLRRPLICENNEPDCDWTIGRSEWINCTMDGDSLDCLAPYVRYHFSKNLDAVEIFDRFDGDFILSLKIHTP